MPAEIQQSSPEKCAWREKTLQLGDAVLQTLAKSKKGNLIGPDNVRSVLGDQDLAEFIENLNGGAEPNLNPTVIAQSRRVAEQLNAEYAVRSFVYRPKNPLDGGGGTGGFGLGWSGRVTMTMELVDLSSLETVRKSYGQGEYSGMAGLLFYVPFYCTTTPGRACDRAARAALKELFEPELTPGENESDHEGRRR